MAITSCIVPDSTQTAALEVPLSDDEMLAFQASLWDLLDQQVQLFTMGESTSLPEYDAHRLLASACFVVGFNPDEPDQGVVRSVVTESARAVFNRNMHRIEAEAARVSMLWRDVCFAVPLVESVALKDTLASLQAFEAHYEPRFFAHEIPADIDYPLSFPVDEAVQGVDYLTTYLERLLAECRFLQLFDVRACRRVLRAVHPEYGELILNLFEPVVEVALGCALAGVDVRVLHLSDADRERVADTLQNSSAEAALVDAAVDVCEQLHIADELTRSLVERVGRNLAPRVRAALR